jgi:GNAT superfamily N-acetyltransferase
MQWARDGYLVTDERERIDAEAAYAFLAGSYWARGLPREVFDRSLRGALCFGLLRGRELAGFCRAITDRATFAYLADVFVLPEHRGRGLGKWLVSCALAHPELQGLRRWVLATADAHGLYAGLGFTPLAKPETFMEIFRPYAAPEQDS